MWVVYLSWCALRQISRVFVTMWPFGLDLPHTNVTVVRSVVLCDFHSPLVLMWTFGCGLRHIRSVFVLVWPSSDQSFFILRWPFGFALLHTNRVCTDVTIVTWILLCHLPRINRLSLWCDFHHMSLPTPFCFKMTLSVPHFFSFSFNNIMTSVKCVVIFSWCDLRQISYILCWYDLLDAAFVTQVYFVMMLPSSHQLYYTSDLPHTIWLSSWCDFLDVTFCLWPFGCDFRHISHVFDLGTLRQISPVLSWCDLLDCTFLTRVFFVLMWHSLDHLCDLR